MVNIYIFSKLVIIVTILLTISESQIDQIEEPQCLIEGQTSVICREYEDFDIKQEFELISSTHPDNDKLYDQLIVYYLPDNVQSLPNNSFYDLKFTRITIYQTFSLESIHTNAFYSTSNVTEFLYLIGTKQLVNNPPEYDLYAAISSLTNLKTCVINLNSDLKHEIPENAFRQINGPQNSLEVIAFTGDFVISRINNNAFSAIPNIRQWILFSFIQIESISSGAFNFAQTSTDRLEIHLNGCGLNDSSFDDNIFSGSQRPLFLNLDSNQIHYISENTFSAFFNANPNNSLSLADNSLDCDNTQQLQWLFDQRDQLQNRVIKGACSDGTLLWDIGFDNQCNATTDAQVVCTVNGSLALKSELKRIFQANPTQSYYDRLIIQDNPVFTELPDDVFMGLNFGEISIYSSPNLMYIHRNAFASTINTTHQLWLSTITQLRDSAPQFDLYYALSTLTNATYINIALDPSLTHLIPDNAFRNINGFQSRLFAILFEGNFRISQIGNSAFYEIPSLETLIFDYTPITRISARAFDFRSASDVTLEIYLPGCQLTDQSFEPNIFSGAQRPLLLDLRNNLINYLDENIFSSFLTADSRNQLNLFGNYLNCTDINRFIWLLQQKDQLESRVLEATCADGTHFWDIELPPSPPTTLTQPSTAQSTTAQSTTIVIDTTTVTISMPITTISTTNIPDFRFCNENYTYDGQYNIVKWPPVRPGDTSYGECPTGFVGIAMWFCQFDSQFETNGPQISCTQEWIEDLYEDILEGNFTSIDEVSNFTNNINDQINDNGITYYEELVKIVDMIERLQLYSNSFIDSNQYLNESKEIVTNSLEIYSNLILRSQPWMEANQSAKGVLSEKIVLQVQNAAFMLGCQQNDTSTETLDVQNIYVENFKLNETGYVLKSSRFHSSLKIPANVNISLTNLPDFCPLRTSFAVIYDRIDQYFTLNLSVSEKIASQIIGFSFTNDTKTHTLNDGLKAKIILEHSERLEFGDKIRCAFWDFAASEWSSDGCERIANESNRDITTCQCNHLTNFAAILDISGRETSGGLKSTFTIIFSSMSCIGLIMTIIMIILAKSNQRKKEKISDLRDTVTCNLCVCLIAVNLLVLFGMSQTNNKWLCQTLSALLLYSLMSAFCWMLFEGIIVYKMTVKVFPDYFRHIKLMNYMFAYGTPILVLVIAITIFAVTNIYDDYGIFDVLFKNESSNYFCWISSPVYPYYIWIFAGPASLVMLVNLIILVLSIKNVCGVIKPNYMLVIGYTSFTFFLGLTWLFFILYIEQFGQYFAYFSYFFIIINGSQGVFIHLFQTIHTARTVKYANDSSDDVNYES